MRRMLPAGLAITLLIFATSCGRDRSKPPAVLQTTPEAIFLIRDNEARCAKIGQEGTQRLAAAEEDAELGRKVRESIGDRVELDLRTGRISRAQTAAEAGSSPEEPKPPVKPSEVFKNYLAEEAAEELAAANAAQGAIQDLLPQVKVEAPADLASAVEALAAAHDQVCLAVRQPRLSTQYRGSLDVAETGYRAAEEKLQPLYTVSATDSQFALRKYRPRLDEARTAARGRSRPGGALPAKDYERDQREWQATQQLQAQQEVEHEVAVKKFYGKRDESPSVPRLGVITKPAQSPEDLAQAMKVWYPRYTAKVGQVKTALAAYLRLRKAGVTGDSLFQSCEAVMAADDPLLKDPVALEPPDPRAAELLRAAFSEIEGLAQACQEGQTAETIIRLDAFERTLAKAATALHAYSLEP
jgi:hypothetical protein